MHTLYIFSLMNIFKGYTNSLLLLYLLFVNYKVDFISVSVVIILINKFTHQLRVGLDHIALIILLSYHAMYIKFNIV